jgi:hypothetical protein
MRGVAMIVLPKSLAGTVHRHVPVASVAGHWVRHHTVPGRGAEKEEPSRAVDQRPAQRATWRARHRPTSRRTSAPATTMQPAAAQIEARGCMVTLRRLTLVPSYLAS